jgi:ADP-heptose:LPS heptosyltransferase
MAEGQGFVDEVIAVTVPWAQHMSRWRKYFSRHWVNLFRCIRLVRSRRFDLGFTARADVRDSFILWAGGAKRRVGYGFAHGGRLLTDIVPPDLSRSHYSERWLHLLEYLEKPILDRRPQVRLGLRSEISQKVFSRTLIEWDFRCTAPPTAVLRD